MEILLSLAGRAANAVVDVTWQQLRYMLDYHDNKSKLGDELRDFKNFRARVGHQVDEAKREQLLEIQSDVVTWISDADETIINAGTILAEDDKTCCFGRLPNFKNRYKLSKRAKLKAERIRVLADKYAKLVRVGYHVPLHPVLHSDDYKAFGSRESTLNSIMDALRNRRDADLIGVYGSGGVGKTTLAKEVGRRMKEEGVFQLVAVAEVHPKADVNTIQEKVAQCFEIKQFPDSNIDLRAAALRKRLLQEESVLVILDDVWEAIDLKKVGIPVGGGNTNRCTVLVTTRLESVVSQMDVQQKTLFSLNVLKDDEAWELFQTTVGLIPEEDTDRHLLATQIVKKCGGLPILILPVAKALKKKKLDIWRDALRRLEYGLHKNCDPSEAPTYLALELSCSQLGEDQKAMFLFCGLIEPYHINIDYVVKYTTGLRLFKDCSTVKATRSRVHKLLDDLKNSCLLLKDGDYFTMHDVVHSFVSVRQDEVFSRTNCHEFGEWPDMPTLEQYTEISLRYCQLPEFPTKLECPKLKVLLLYEPPDAPGDMFFDAIEELRVLDVTGVWLSPLPSSIQRLQNLQTLCLDHCGVEDVAVIGILTQLKILSLIGAEIVHLPKEIGKLTRLQQLDLSRCWKLKKISPGVLSCLTDLEELYMKVSFTQWGLRDEIDGNQRNADLAELKELKKLTALEIGVPDVTSLPDDLFSDKLERFFIFIGDCWNWSRNNAVSATLKVKLDARIQVLKKVNLLLKKVDDLHLDNSDRVKNVRLPDLILDGFGVHLKNLQLQNFHEVRCLINFGQSGSRIAFPMLEALVIENAQHLEKIFNGPPKEKSLANLKHIEVSRCHALSNVFPLSVARCVSKLEEIQVTYCEKMEGIFIVDEADVKDEKIHLTQLRKLTVAHVPSLGNILSLGPSAIKDTREDAFASDVVLNKSTLPLTFFNEKIVIPNIVDLKVCSHKIHKIWDSEFPDSYSCFRNLATLEIDGCKFIKHIFTISMVNSLTQLKIFTIRNCELLQEIIIQEKQGETNKICLPKLEWLSLGQLDSLVRVCTGELIECPNLDYLEIHDCPQLRTFITSSSHQPDGKSLFDNKVLFPSLVHMRISNMDSLIMLWHGELHEDSFSKLNVLMVHKTRSLSKLFSSNTMITKVHTLEELSLMDCDLLEEVFDLRDLMLNKRGKYPEKISKLKVMVVLGLPNLKHVWHGDPHGILSFQNLIHVKFQECSSLESLIPASMAQQLERLEEIVVIDCSSLEQIISKEERDDAESDATFQFPCLKRIWIWNAPKMSSFYPGKHPIEWPAALEDVSILKCPKLEVFKPQQGQPLISLEQEFGAVRGHVDQGLDDRTMQAEASDSPSPVD